MYRKIDNKYSIEVKTELLPNDHQTSLVIRNSINGKEIPEDEPLFLLRARDAIALSLLLNYYQLCASNKCTKEHLEGIQKTITTFDEWKKANADKMKQPVCTMPQDLYEASQRRENPFEVKSGTKVVTPEPHTVGKKKLLDQPEF